MARRSSEEPSGQSDRQKQSNGYIESFTGDHFFSIFPTAAAAHRAPTHVLLPSLRLDRLAIPRGRSRLKRTQQTTRDSRGLIYRSYERSPRISRYPLRAILPRFAELLLPACDRGSADCVRTEKAQRSSQTLLRIQHQSRRKDIPWPRKSSKTPGSILALRPCSARLVCPICPASRAARNCWSRKTRNRPGPAPRLCRLSSTPPVPK